MNIVYYALFCILTIILTSCGINYEKNSTKIKSALNQNKNYTFSKKNNKDYLLNNQEAGLFWFFKNDFNQSLNYFNKAISTYQQNETKNPASVNKALSYTVVSDMLLPYEGSDYELGLVHYYSGLSYLGKSDLAKAAIEFKAVEDNQQFAVQSRNKQVIASENSINKFFKKYNLSSKDFDNIMKQTQQLRADSRNKFLNANSLYLAGIVRELNKSTNDALVNYKQAYEIEPNNKYLLEDLYRLSLIYDHNYAAQLKQLHSYLNDFSVQEYNSSNTIYLIYEQGYIPQKENLKITLESPAASVPLVLTLNLPVYSNDNIPQKNVRLMINSKVAEAQYMANIFNLAKNNLIEQYPAIISRQIGKLATQIATQVALKSSSKSNGMGLGYFAGHLNALDSSDVRSWRTLPSIVKVAKINTQSPVNKILVKINNVPYYLDLSLNNSEIAIVYIYDTGKHIYDKILYKSKK